jgi:hypothetical protein
MGEQFGSGKWELISLPRNKIILIFLSDKSLEAPRKRRPKLWTGKCPHIRP